MDPTRYKQLKTQRRFNYSYYWSPPAPGNPVLFFAHGFPAGSFLWRKQVEFFEPLGYGLLVPDFLGYGATDKPTDPKVYIGSGHARDIVDILDAEGIEKVVAIAHDRGIYPVSRLINYHPQRVAACAFLAGSYSPPAAKGSTDRAFQQEAVTKTFGYDAFAYMRFFVHPDAPAIIEEHIDSFLSLVYPENVQLWRDHLSVDGGARKWIESDARSPLPSYMTPEDHQHLKNALLTGGITAPLCWYRAPAEGFTAEDDAQIPPEAAEVKQPLLYVAFTGDILALPRIADAVHAQYVTGPVTRREVAGDHWAAEAHSAGELNVILLEWVRGLGV